MGRSTIRLALHAIGAALVLSGILWAFQGLGIASWPAGSPMLGVTEWAFYGAIAAAIGAMMVLLSHRLR